MGKSMKPGGGGRFAKLSAKLAKQPGVTDPDALAAAIGRKKYGAKKMAQFASHMPPGASLSPHGDLGYQRQQESEASTKKFNDSRSVRASREMPVRNMQVPK